MGTYKGYLLKFGNTPFPNKYINANSYQAAPLQRTENKAYRDANYLLHRNTNPNSKTSIEFSSRNGLHLKDKIQMKTKFKEGLLDSLERKYKVTYWDDDLDEYRTGIFYFADPKYPIMRTDDDKEDIIYGPIQFTLTEY